jgi:hypothetical protein
MDTEQSHMQSTVAINSIFEFLNRTKSLTAIDIRNVAKSQNNGSITASKKVMSFLKQWESSHHLSAPEVSNRVGENAAMATKKKPSSQFQGHVCEDCTADDKVTLKSLIVLQTQHMKEFELMMKEALLGLQKNYDQLALVAEFRGKRPRAHTL